ncbi:hypothetical protein GCM10010341_22620 [Streptomyces noursei]|nr:hypothetical protein GCM10010341_22620 [Streptomyces noursei]
MAWSMRWVASSPGSSAGRVGEVANVSLRSSAWADLRHVAGTVIHGCRRGRWCHGGRGGDPLRTGQEGGPAGADETGREGARNAAGAVPGAGGGTGHAEGQTAAPAHGRMRV